MTKKELNQLYYLRREITRLEELIETLESRAQGDGRSFIGVSGNNATDRTGKYAVKIADARRRLDCLRKKCVCEADRLIGYIDGIEDSHLRQIFALRYINGLSWYKVACGIGGNNTEDSVRMMVTRHIAKG